MDKTAVTINAYNKNVKKFADKFMEYKTYIDMVTEFSKYIKIGDKILDLGCGPGNVAKCIRENVGDVEITGIDLSEEMLKIARLVNPHDKFICEDLRNINFDSESFDGVIMSFCIVHLFSEEAEIFIRKAVSYMKENGKLYISFMEGKNEGFEKTSFSNDEIFFNYYSQTKIENELRKLNIRILNVSRQVYDEPDGSKTTDVFIFGEKESKNHVKNSDNLSQ